VLLDAQNVTMAFGAFKAVDDVSVAVSAGEVLGLIGPNGAGKSTFFNCLTGDLAPSSGTIHFEGRDVTRMTPEDRAALGIARTFQVPLTFESMSVLDNVMICAIRVRAPLATRHERSSTTSVSDMSLPRLRGVSVHPAASAWRSPGRSPPNPRCCCWTRPWPG
jgi:branched-chain amino acid transport system ATP-binding protein